MDFVTASHPVNDVALAGAVGLSLRSLTHPTNSPMPVIGIMLTNADRLCHSTSPKIDPVSASVFLVHVYNDSPSEADTGESRR
jgi:hypothetical protein